MAQGTRLDERVVADGLADSRSIAQRLIMAGQVRVDGHPVSASSHRVKDAQDVTVLGRPRFVSRGGDKLENGIADLAVTMDRHGLDPTGLDAIDVGSSTGGFTDCLLQRGVRSVVAVDVGYGQLHNQLLRDPRVTSMERTNARTLTPAMLPFRPQLIVCDASFIPLQTVLPAALACMEPGFWGLLLCKPQFQAGRERLARGGSKGVIRDGDIRQEILEETISEIAEIGLRLLGSTEARPRGPKGNVEYVLLVCDHER